ncbi:MAG: polyhydroxyalkanoic acid system family protein [Pseudobdellovibrionaceae bacterium]
MPKFSVQHQTKLAKIETYTKIKNFFGSESELGKLAPGAKAQFNDGKSTCQISGTGFKANVEILEAAAGSQVVVHVDLGMLLTPLKGKVEEVLKKKLAQHLG